ncbi:DUF1194 domain-containing protein [Consotaella salsifontis]|uniref:VWFA domain-containing protein n=1 Tax=Consotaella salsifontis TaxID=1365950 RepID=A0A1T4L9B1_9HYPH|nr:DUF1194 domain-containing protein [Consotaella salsifontis]SJZ51372.1 Protein of unknown function [Consotaella salsifontis]
MLRRSASLEFMVARSAFVPCTHVAVTAAIAWLGLDPASAQSSAGESRVDVELVLAVDISWSMNAEEQEIQRAGYAAAFRSDEVQKAILGSGWGRIAVTYVEWAGTLTQEVVIPWTLIDSEAAADDFAAHLDNEEPGHGQRTSIAAAIDYSVPLFEGNGFAGIRRVIDLSGDGPNNEGRAVNEARDDATRRGIVINGLPLMTSGFEQGFASWGSIPNLDRYYADCVIGGPGAFMIPVNDWEQFPDAVRRKLVMELAGAWPEPEGATLPLIKVQDPPSSAPADCLVGEKLWEQRRRGWAP